MSVLVAVLAAAALALAAGAQVASGATFCVQASSCSGTSEADLQTALNAAKSASPGPNTVMVGAGTVIGNFSYSGSSLPALTLQGAGPGTTILTYSGDSMSGLYIGGNSADLVSGFTVKPTAGTGTSAVVLETGTATNIAVTATSATPQVTGVALAAGTSLTHSTVTLPLSGGLESQAVDSGCCATTGRVVVSDDTLTGDEGANITTGTAFIARDKISADYEGARCGVNCTVEDSLVAMMTNSFDGFESYCQTTASVTASLVNDTIVGPSNDSVFADCLSSGQSAAVTASSTVLRGAAQHAFDAIASFGGSASIAPSYDDFDPATDSTSGASASIASDANHITADPLFIAPAAGDFRIPYNSPLVDKGDPAGIGFLESPTDLAGNPRIVNGRRDIGAYEYQRLKPNAVITESATTAPTGEAITFDGSGSSDGDPGDTLTYSWSFDDGASAVGATAIHAFRTAGIHTATLTVTDSTNLAGTATASVRVTGQVSLTHLTQSASTWTGGGALAVFSRLNGRRRIQVGTTFGFTLNIAASVQIAFTRLLTGRAIGGKCVALTRRNRRAHACTRLFSVGALTHAAHAGANTVRFQGRLTANTRLPLGRYRATFTATSPSSHASAPVSLTFTIVARR
jgi:PKD repeat protein